jgi:proton-translocating NADH-quinone oxidoreductase chain L
MDFVLSHSYLIPLLPLIGAVISGFFGARWLRGQSHWPIWIGVGISAVLSIILLVGLATAPESAGHAGALLGQSAHWYTWIHVGGFRADAGAWIDPLSAIMLSVVTGVGLLITIFSKGYMAGEEGYFRFFAYLGLFIFSMTILVMANNFVMLYLGWEGVGLCSYLLIGYYYERPAARDAAQKAFLVNRVGDLGFYIGILLIFLAFGSVSFFGNGVGTHTGVFERALHATGFQATALQWIPFLLLVGAVGKSAQVPLYVWLPDAMEGPTPVSALIHAATMVTAGVYMIARCSTLFVGNQAVMITITVIGCFTALFAATIAMRQFDLKKVLAYSTISQLAFMFVAVGVLAPVAGIFHLVTHAFFKALLFLAAGVVMHAMAGELDMRKISGLKRVLPWTRWFMLAGCLALAGFPPFSGFWSKDEIVVAAMDQNVVLGVLMLLAAFLTAYYTFRLYFRVFEGPELIPTAPAAAHDGDGEPHAHAAASESAVATATAIASASGVDEGQAHHAPADHDHGDSHSHEPLVMLLPLALLTIGAIFAGLFNFPGDWLGGFLGKSPSFALGWTAIAPVMTYADPSRWGQVEVHHIHLVTMVISGLVSLAGILLAYYSTSPTVLPPAAWPSAWPLWLRCWITSITWMSCIRRSSCGRCVASAGSST